MKKKWSWSNIVLATAAGLLAVVMLSAGSLSIADHKGKPHGKTGGGGDPPSTPPVLYELRRFTLPEDYLGGGWSVLELNDFGELVGNYVDGFVANGRQPFYLDTDTGNTVATNLNDIQYDDSFGVPDGWYITRAQGINNLGDIAGGLAWYGDPNEIRGCVIEMRPDPDDDSVKPRIHLIPDSKWSRTYARRINDVGVVLGRGTPVQAYVYQAPLHGQTGDDSVTEISTPFDAWFGGYLTNPINGGPTLLKVSLGLTDEILTYNVNTGTSSFTDVSSLGIADIRGFNDSGSFCGFYDIAKGKNKGRYGYVFDGVFQSLDGMKFSNHVNNSGDVAGAAEASQPVLYHPKHGVLLLNDLIVAESDEEKAIWDDNNRNFISSMTERNDTGFPVLAGSMERPNSPYSLFNDGFVLFPIVP